MIIFSNSFLISIINFFFWEKKFFVIKYDDENPRSEEEKIIKGIGNLFRLKKNKITLQLKI